MTPAVQHLVTLTERIIDDLRRALGGGSADDLEDAIAAVKAEEAT